MQSKSAAWWSALTAPIAEWRYGLDLLAANEQTLLEQVTSYDQSAQDRLIAKSGQIVVDVTAKTHRTFSLNLRNSDGRYLPGPLGYPSGGNGSSIATGLVWYTVRYRPWVDLVTAIDGSGNKTYDRTYLGIYCLVTPEAQVLSHGPYVTLTLMDKSSLLQKPFYITNSTLPVFSKNGLTVGGFLQGTNVISACHALALAGGIPTARHNMTPNVTTLPADYAISEGDEFWTHLQVLASSIGFVIYFDGAGTLVCRADPTAQNLPSLYTFAPGPLSITAKLDRKTDLSVTYNHVIVIGAGAQSATYRGEATLQNAASPYHANNIGDRPVFWGKTGLGDMTPDPTIGSVAQAQTKAQIVLAQHIGQLETIKLTGRNVPAIEPFDRVSLAFPLAGLNLDVLIQQITWNMSHDGMEVDATAFWAAGS